MASVVGGCPAYCAFSWRPDGDGTTTPAHCILPQRRFAAIFGEMSAASRIVYVLVGIAAIWTLISSASLRNTNRDADHTRMATRP